jgi:hypothetical protein
MSILATLLSVVTLASADPEGAIQLIFLVGDLAGRRDNVGFGIVADAVCDFGATIGAEDGFEDVVASFLR